MLEKKIKISILLFILIIPAIFLPINTIFKKEIIGSNKNPDQSNENGSTKLRISATYNNIEINDLPNSLNNWAWAETQPWCRGSGNETSPYKIDTNVFTSEKGDGLRILNSRKYFIIRNNIFKDAPGNGLYLDNVTNGQIINNEVNNNHHGIYLDSTNDTVISDNDVINNDIGIWLVESDENNITGNIINDNQIGIYLYQSNYNSVIENTLMRNDEAIVENNSIKNIIRKNTSDKGESFPSEIVIIIIIISIIIIGGISGAVILKKKVFRAEKKEKVLGEMEKLKEEERRAKERLKEEERREKKRLKEEEKLEKERLKKEKERQKIEEKRLMIEQDLQNRISLADDLIKENNFEMAIKNLNEILEIAKSHNFNLIIIEVEKRLLEYKKTQVDTVNRIKQTIKNLGRKYPRLQLMDISEKSGVKDEILIEHMIQEMIKNKEIHGDYFSSSKSLVLEVAAPVSVSKAEKEFHVFLSYSTLDADYFEISNIVKRLELYPEIRNVFFWEADSGENIVTFMEQTLKETNVFVLFCSENSIKSKAVEDEWQAAFQLRKEGLMKMVPVYENDDHIPYLLKPILNVKFTKDDFEGFVEKLYKEILR